MEEEKQELTDAFADLPDATSAEAEEAKEEVKEEVKEEAKTQPEVDQKDQKYQRILADKDRAIKEERRKARDAAGEIEKLRNELKASKVKPEEVKEEADEAKSELDPEKLANDVVERIAQKTYSEQLTGVIKAVPGITKGEARELQEAVSKLPRSGNVERDVKAARAWLKSSSGNEEVSVPQSPMSMGMGAFRTEPKAQGDVSELQKQFGKKYGQLTDDDYKKFNGLNPQL